MSRRGFTLLEVLVAVSILGLGLTVILSSQASLLATSNKAEKLSLAVSLLRCRMSETELDLVKTGYPLADESHEGDCCMEGESDNGFSCSWKIERVKLPEPSLGEELDGGGAEGIGALDQLTQLTADGGLGPGADLGALGGDLGAGAAEALGPMLMGMVYPQLKPMLEASIRKVTVTIAWKEGKLDRSLNLVQFVTDPQQGQMETDADGGVLGEVNRALNNITGGSTTSDGG
jgi:prepilin-type N-terminal cleavage/methylation domain-containing protein